MHPAFFASVNKKTMKITSKRALGCLIALGNISYRIIHVYQKRPAVFSAYILHYSGRMACHSFEPQFVKVMAHGRRRFVELGHARLQHGHKGVLYLYAEVTRFGKAAGTNRWLRVPLDFPDVISAENAARVKKPHQKRRKLAPLVTAVLPVSDEPLSDVQEVNLQAMGNQPDAKEDIS